MSKSATVDPIPLPKSWPQYIKAGVIHAISLAHFGLTFSRGWAADSPLARVRLSDKLDVSDTDNALLREEMRIKDNRMEKIDPRKRPHYSPTDRMAILEVRAACGWNTAETARRFLLEPDTISSWMDRLNDQDDSLLKTSEPVNKFPDFVRYVVQRLKALCPRMGKERIAQILTRAGLVLSTTTAGRILKEEPVPPMPEFPAAQKPQSNRLVTSKYPHHVWNIDLTVVPTDGSWVPWDPFCFPQIWRFFWWVAVIMDHFSRVVVGFSVFFKEPSTEEMQHMLALAIENVGKTPRHLISDQGPQFTAPLFMTWCADQLRDIHQRFGAVGQYGSIAVLERFMRSLKQECTRQIRVPRNPDDIRRTLSLYITCYNEFRPHQGLGGRVPMDLCLGVDTRADPMQTRGDDGITLELLVSFLEGQPYLPVVELEAAA